MQLNRTFIKKRVLSLESNSDNLMGRVAELERWRIEHEENNKKDFDKHTNDIKLTNDKLKAFYDKYQKDYAANDDAQVIQDNKINDILLTLEANKEERAEINLKIDVTAEQ